MNPKFWLEKWHKNEIGFHMDEVNPMLVKHINRLSLKRSSRVFLPLCGKTKDIAWLLAQGHQVVGIELIETAVEQLFKELGTEPRITHSCKHKLYQTDNLQIFVGDVFALTAQTLGSIDAIYDRAALVALPKMMRLQYSKHLGQITKHTQQLLISYAYDQSLRPGPPFSVNHQAVTEHYAQDYQITLLEHINLPGVAGGTFTAQELVWLLQTK